MIKEKIDNVLQKFSSQYLITIQVLSSDNFQSQISTLINQFQQNTITAYKHINDFIWFNTFYNRILSGLRSNFYMRSISDVTTVLTNQYGTGSSSCTCRRDDKCTYPAYIYNDTGRIGIGGSSIFDTTNNDPHVMFILPNTRVGCYPYQSLLTSTFECFYDQSCLDSLQKFIPEFSLLSPLKLSRYSTETSINDLLNNLFIESWNEIYNFSKYYEICSPKLCTYSFTQSFNLLYIIVTLFSLFGGLKVILFLSIPINIRLIRKIKKSISRRNQTIINIPRNENQTLKNRLRIIHGTIFQQVLTYNMFPLSNDIKDGIYSTRFYILFLTVEYTLNYDRKTLSGFFNALSSFCTLTRNIIKQNIETFSTKQFITLKTLTYSSFQRQIDSTVDDFIVQTLTQFQWIHRYITDMFHANQLQHRFYLNWQSFVSNEQMGNIIETFPIWFNESNQSCLCTTSPSQCIVFGCLPIDGLRQSTLECFYNSTCLNELAQFFNITTKFPNVLNQSVPTRFNPLLSVTLGELIDKLFVETWQNSSNYSNYYSSCSPSSCEYNHVERNNILYTITTFLGLYGGLTVGLKLFAWHSLNIYWKTRQHFGNRRRTTQVIPIN
ncbi:hypothetical protein I4U23_016216 [Adineta vaga]|nr:hypothetical protein I4U23_016216 [Adineta vaga]